MEHVFSFLFGFAMTLTGCVLAILSMRRTIRENAHKLEESKNDLTKPESYIWVNVEDRLPTQNQEYLVEYCYESNPDMRFASVHWFYVRERRFQYEDFPGFNLKVVRWAELPR